MSGTLTIRPAQTADMPRILEVLKASLGETELLRRTPELFSWKHETNPFGRSIVLLAEDRGRIAGVRAFMRWNLQTVDGDTIRCVRAVDTATHPDFRGKGIFTSLTMTALEQAKSEGIDLIFNTPNAQSGAGYLKMGWESVGWIRPMVRISIRGVKKAKAPMVELSDILTDANEMTGEIEIADRPAVGLRTPRTREYMKWRFGSHPTAKYGKFGTSDRGFAVVRASVRNGRTELLVSDLHAGSRLLREAARRSRAQYMATSFTPTAPERRTALAAGLVPVPAGKGLHLVARPLADLPVDVHDLGSWDLALSDLELL